VKSGAEAVAHGIAKVVESTPWVAPQISNIYAATEFAHGKPYNLDTLIERAQGDSEPGYHDHHIVEQGPQNDDLSPEELNRIDDPENIVRIPYYTHQLITNYYRNPDPRLPGGVTPRQYLRGKSFDERYQFGLDVLRQRGVIK